MKRRRNIMIVAILLMAIGFATVTTNLIINGSLLIGNNDDFVVIFTSAKLNGLNRSRFISSDKKTITFETNTLTTMKDVETLEFEVTNTSRNYNANVVITCTPTEHEYVELTLPSEMTVEAGTSEKERIIARLKKVTSEEQSIEINCTLTATAEERDNLGNEYVAPFSKAGTLMATSIDMETGEATDKFWLYRNEITKVVFEPVLNPYETREEFVFDVSENQDGSVMAYIIPTLTEEEINAALEEFIQEDMGITLEEFKQQRMEEGMTEEEINAVLEQGKVALGLIDYTLYIQSETGIKANEDSSYLFAYFNNLTSIEGLEYLDTSNVTNMTGMFATILPWLSSFDLNNFENNKEPNKSSMFIRGPLLSQLSSLDLSSFDTRNVIDMSGMFYGLEVLSDLKISSFDTSNVTNMMDMFAGCSSLTTLDVSNFDTRNVIDMSEMFWGCSSLTKLDVSNFDTSNVTSMESMFEECSSLIKLDVSQFDTRNVIDMSWMFSACYDLTTLDVSNFDTSNATRMENMFASCYDLTDLYLGRIDVNNNASTSSIFKSVSSTLNIHIKDNATKDWILGLDTSDRPREWNDNNFILTA